MELKLLLLQLNEINFEIVEKYLSNSPQNKFANLKKIKKKYNSFFTYAEDQYENLEPWIQWTSVHLGKSFNQHGIFRLGDIVKYPTEKQIFEIIEDKGFKVGAICPMNAENRLKDPSYFIPDPWTDTLPDTSRFSKKLSLMLKQTINDNASGKLSLTSIITILGIFFKTFNLTNSIFLMNIVLSCIIKPWKKSLVLEYLIHLVHMYFLKKKKSDFSSIFLNVGAHIQHHYMFNSKYVNPILNNPKWYIKSSEDPFEEMLEMYDKIIGNYLKLLSSNTKLIISTGL